MTDAVQIDTADDAARRVEYPAQSVIRDAYQRETFLDGARPGDREVLIRAGSVPVPGIVGNVQDPSRPVALIDHCAREYDLVTDERGEGRQSRQRDCLRAGARRDID